MKKCVIHIREKNKEGIIQQGGFIVCDDNPRYIEFIDDATVFPSLSSAKSVVSSFFKSSINVKYDIEFILL